MPSLDGLRGIAILLVIALHVAFVSAFVPPAWASPAIREFAHGVQLFFVVSAFTLTLRFRSGPSELAKFATRRIARIGPAFWLMSTLYGTLTAVGAASIAGGTGDWTEWALSFSFMSAWSLQTHGGLVPGSWSVSCEVCFYCVLPFCIWLIEGRIWCAAALSVIAAVVAQFWARQAIVGQVFNHAFVYNPIEQLPVFLFGVTAATVVKRYRIPFIPGATAVFLLIAIWAVPLRFIAPWQLALHLQFGILASFAVAWAAVHPPRWLAHPALCKIGQVSFSMYLIHWALLDPAAQIGHLLGSGSNAATSGVAMLVCTGGTFALSVLSYRLLERPMIEWAARQTRSGAPLPAHT